MPLFKFRKGRGEPAAAAPPPESIEALRRRARHRLIGASVLVLVGVVGFPLLFDTQPRPIAVDIPIEIPDRNKVKPLAVPVPAAGQVPAVSGAVTPAVPATVAAPAASPAAPAAAAAPARPPAPPEPAPQAVTEAKPPVVAKAEPRAEARPEAPSRTETKPPAAAARPQDDGTRAQALLEGKAAQAAEGRFVVQVGAFADPDKARETRLRVERAGLKTYTHVAETKDGRRIRVRVGPFASRAEADKAADKIKGLDLPAAILTL